MTVVSDASVLIHMARIGRFDLLRSLYGELVIGSGVYFEVVDRGWGFPGSAETQEAIKDNWLKVRSVADKTRAMRLMHEYGVSLGNAETVQLAVECKAGLALADELEVRNLLEEARVKVRGCIGLLIEAARKHMLQRSEAEEAIGRLVETGYRVGSNVLKRAYQLLGESR
jgi:predicted nucleic acid-binding protein